MKDRYTTIDRKPEWVTEQEEKGFVILHNASRHLLGNATNDTWNLPFVRGRHYAALSPSDPSYGDWVARNTALDAVRLMYVTEQEARSVALEWYAEHMPKMYQRVLAKIDEERIQTWLLEKGLGILNNLDVDE